MTKFLISIVAVCIVALTASTADAAKRKHVRIHKPAPVCNTPGCDQWSKGQVPLAAVPVIAVAFDIARRTSCDPRVAISTGPGDPGFDPNGPKTGNWLVPAIYRRECNGARPKWYGW